MPYEDVRQDLLRKANSYYDSFINSFNRRHMSQIEKDFLNMMGSGEEVTAQVLFQPKVFSKKIQQVKEELDDIILELESAVEEAWERVLSGAKEDMAMEADDEKEDEDDENYTDPDEFDDYDVFNKYEDHELLSWMSQEIGHNVEGRIENWDKYIGKNAIPWNSFRRNVEDIDYFVLGETVRPLEEKLDRIYEDFLNQMKRLKKDYNTSKPEFIKQLFEEGRSEWVVDAWKESEK